MAIGQVLLTFPYLPRNLSSCHAQQATAIVELFHKGLTHAQMSISRQTLIRISSAKPQGKVRPMLMRQTNTLTSLYMQGYCVETALMNCQWEFLGPTAETVLGTTPNPQ